MNDTRMFADQIAAGIAQYLPDDGQMECRVVETTKNNNVSRVGLASRSHGTALMPSGLSLGEVLRTDRKTHV